MIVAAHVSMSGGGLVKACERAAGIGCNGMQIFTGSPRMWKSASVNEFKFEGFEEAKKKNGIEYVVIHATYLVNLASDKPELVEKSRNALINDMKICARGKMAGVVVHVGSHQGRGYEAMKEQMIEEIGRILDESPEESRFLIENSAGQKGKIGSDLREVKELIDGVGSISTSRQARGGTNSGARLGWCFDTCHGWAAGLRPVNSNFQSSNPKQITNVKSKIKKALQDGLFGEEITPPSPLLKRGENDGRGDLWQEIERLGLWETLECVHVNDSRDDFGSGKDRHANLGEGEIGNDLMREYLGPFVKKDLPMVLEVPGFDGKGPDAENVRRLREMVEGVKIK